METLKGFYEHLDFNFSELEQALYAAKNCKAGSLDAIFKVDEFINLCRWFLEDAFRAIERMDKTFFDDQQQASNFQEKLKEIIGYISVPFAVLQKRRWKLWELLQKDIPELLQIMFLVN